MSAHDLKSWTATARLLLGDAPLNPLSEPGGSSRVARIIGLDPLRREAVMCLPPPIILFQNKQLKVLLNACNNDEKLLLSQGQKINQC